MKYLAALSCVALMSCGPESLPVKGLFDGPTQSIASTQIALDHFKAICIAPNGNETQSFNAMGRLNFFIVEGAILGKYASEQYQLAVDLRSQDGTVKSCTQRWVTTEAFDTLQPQFNALRANSEGNISIIGVESLNGVGRPADSDPKTFTFNWSAPFQPSNSQ